MTFDSCANYLRMNTLYIDHVNASLRTSRLIYVTEEPIPSWIIHVKDQLMMTSSFLDIKGEMHPDVSGKEEMTVDKVVHLFHIMAQKKALYQPIRLSATCHSANL